jgi:outer membrane protein assembly factor BamB
MVQGYVPTGSNETVLLRLQHHSKGVSMKLFLCCFSILVFCELSPAADIWQTPVSVKKLPPTCRKIESKKGDVVIPYVLRKIPLGNGGFDAGMGKHPNTFVRFSPDSRYLAIGTTQGHILVAEVYSDKILWNKKVAEGMVKRIDFSPDGKKVYFGEQSVDGFIYAAETFTGKILWKFRLADDLQKGSPPAKDDPQDIYNKPGCYQLKTLSNGDVMALGIHSDSKYGSNRALGGNGYCMSRIYRFSPDGKILWAFPADSPILLTVIYLDCDPDGKSVAFLTNTEGGNRPENYQYFNGTLYVLNGASGKERGHYTFEPLKPWFSKISFWQSVSVSNNGNYASIGTQDGRSFLFELKNVMPVKTFDFGAPVMISGVPVSAYASYTRIAPDNIAYFQTSNTSVIAANLSRTIVAPPGPHPNANMINAVTLDGKISWRYKSNLSCENFWVSNDGRWMMTTAQANKGKTGHEAGALLFDTQRSGGGSSKMVYFYSIEGTVFFHADMAPDGSAFAIVESPYKDPETSKLVGTYQVHVVR